MLYDPVLMLVFTFVAAGIGAYLGSYLKKKGENLATHEDIDKLVEQVGAVTQKTKEIEAKISIDMWSRQQRWDVQKSVLLESLKELASAEALLWSMAHAFAKTKDPSAESRALRAEMNDKYAQAIHGFWRTQLSVDIICGKQVAAQQGS